MRWEPRVKLCPGHRAGQARSCVALTGTHRKGDGASGAPAEVSRHQQPTLPSQRSSITAATMGEDLPGTDLAALRAARRGSGCKLGHGFLALLPRRLCDHPRFTHGCSLTEAEQPRTTCTLSSSPQAAPAPSTVSQPWGWFPAQGQQWVWSALHPSHGDHAPQEVLL